MIEYLLLDLDDTIYPEREFVLSGYKTWITQLMATYSRGRYFFPRLYKELVKRYDRGFHKDNLFYLLHMFMEYVDQETIDFFVNLYRYHTPQIEPYSDFIEFLKLPQIQKIYNQENHVIILTDGDKRQQTTKMLELNKKLPQGFKYKLIINDSIERYKPHFNGYHEVFNTMGISLPDDSNKILCIGDNKTKDFYMCNLLGIKTVQIKRDNQVHSHKDAPNKDYEPEYVISKWTELFTPF